MAQILIKLGLSIKAGDPCPVEGCPKTLELVEH